MKTAESVRSVISESTGGEKRHFGVSREDEAHVLMMLRDALYGDKIMAVLREYSSNAWDAHRAAGKPGLPFEVTLPTPTNPTLVVRDFGPGISHEDMMGRFLMAGSSTKRGDDDSVGTFGIGRLSGFAYGDSFVVESRHDGRRRTYVAALDQSERGEIRLVDDQPAGFVGDVIDTGLTIKIACKSGDCAAFADRARALFTYFEPRPKINIQLPPLPPRVGRGFLQDSSADSLRAKYAEAAAEAWTVRVEMGWHAVMGCVRYPIDLAQVAVDDFMRKLGGVLYFGIGELRVVASREALKYDEGTKTLVAARMREFVDDHVRRKLEALERAGITPWQKRVEAQALRAFDLPWLHQLCGDLMESRAEIKTEIKADNLCFSISHANKLRKNAGRDFPGIDVDERTRLIIRDDKRAISGFSFGWHDYMVKSPPVIGAAKLGAILRGALVYAGCDGVPVVKTSALPWTKPFRDDRLRGAKNPVVAKKYAAKTFVYKGNGLDGSDAWDITERVPEKTDIFVVLDKFRAGGFYADACLDFSMLRAFGIEPPVIYGYKAEVAEAAKGLPYAEWRKRVPKLVLKCRDARAMADYAWLRKRLREPGNDVYISGIEHTVENLGEKHPIAAMLRVVLDGERLKQSRDARALHADYLSACVDKDTPAKRLHARLSRRYPLLFAVGVWELWGKHSARWIEYAKKWRSR